MRVEAREVKAGQTARVAYGDFDNLVDFEVLEARDEGGKVTLVGENKVLGRVNLDFRPEEPVEVIGWKEPGRMNIQEKLMRVQSALKAPKNQYNKFGNYYYRNCEDIQEAAKPLLKEVKAALVVGDELVMIGERYYIKATARFLDCESGEAVVNTAYAREEREKKGMDVSQVTGSASSYARKYALNGLFCIDDVKDADNQDNGGSKTGKTAAKGGKEADNQDSGGPGPGKAARGVKTPVNTTGSHAESEAGRVTKPMIESVKSMVDKYSGMGLKMEKILAMYKIRDISEMSWAQYEDCMEKLKLYEKGESSNE